ncbi:zinc finger protein 1 [Parasteatoda tepidariorum]|uniref:zinc finger protein 1 n=1 Tax=Parasteatoda tepidariorum TaxID=114398 RepID=UPI001C723E99|nr:zinc finger protein 1 isoform X1 [Parasteatoda tepidariorum]
MSAPNETDESKGDDTKESSDFSVGQEDRQKDKIEESGIPDILRKSDETNIGNIEKTSENERKPVLDDKCGIDGHSEKLSALESVSEKVIQADTGEAKIASETTTKFILDIKDNTTEDSIEVLVPDSDFESGIQSDKISRSVTSTVKRKLYSEVSSLEYSNDLHPSESPNKVVKSTSMKLDVKTEISPELQVSERFELKTQLQETDSTETKVEQPEVELIENSENVECDDLINESKLKDSADSNDGLLQKSGSVGCDDVINEFKLTDSASSNVRLIQKSEDVDCGKTNKESINSGIVLDLSSHHQELNSKRTDVTLPNVGLTQEPANVECYEINKESVKTIKAQKFDKTDNKIPEKEKELDIVKLYRIQKWLKGISTYDLTGKFIPSDSSSTSSSSTSKRKLEVKDSISVCSRDGNPSVSPNKMLKMPEQDQLDPVSLKSEIAESEDNHLYTCNRCFQLFLTQEDLDDHSASCKWYFKDTPVSCDVNLDLEGERPLQDSLGKKSSLESQPGENLGEKYSIPISSASQKLDSDNGQLQQFYKCPECGCLLSCTDLDLCYHHAVTCFFVNMPRPDCEVTRPDDILDSGGNYSVTHSDNTVTSEFLYNMLNFYKTQFIISTIQISEVTDDYASSSESSHYNCPICIEPVQNQSLRQHIKNKHMKKTFSARDAARELAADASKHEFVKGRVFKCKKCGEKFSSFEGIKLHIDAFAKGNCGPGSHISEPSKQNVISGAVDRGCCSGSSQTPIPIEKNTSPETADSGCNSESSQIPIPIEQNATPISVDRDCYPGSSQIPYPIEQSTISEAGVRDSGLTQIPSTNNQTSTSHQGFSQITESVELTSGVSSADKSFGPGTSRIPDPVKENDGCESAECGDRRGIEVEGAYSDPYASNYVEETAFTCRHCFYACEHLDDMVDHYSIHELLRVCYPSNFESPDAVSNQFQVCPYCLKQFEDWNALTDHFQLIYTRQFTCTVCHEFLATLTDYDYHLQEHETDIIKIYRDSRNDAQLTNSTEDQDNTKSMPKRRRKRSKKATDNQKSDKSSLVEQANHPSPNAKHVGDTSRLNIDTNSSYEQKAIKDDTIKNDANESNIELEHRFNTRLQSDQFIQSPTSQERGCTNMPSDENNKKQTSRYTSVSSKCEEEFRSIASPPSPQIVQSSNYSKVATKNMQHDEENIKKELEEEKFQRNLEETIGSSVFSEIPSTQAQEVLSAKVSCEQEIKDIRTTNKEFESNSETLISVAGSSSQQIKHSSYVSQIVSSSVSSDQEDITKKISKESEKNVQESLSVTPKPSVLQFASSVDQEDITREDNEKTSDVSERNLKSSKSATDSLSPEIVPCTQQIVSTNASSNQDDIITENKQKSISVTSSSVSQQESCIDQEDVIKEGKESEENKHESISPPSSSISQSASSCDQEDTNKRDCNKTSQNCEGNFEAFVSAEDSKSPPTAYIDIISTDIPSDQKDITREENKESERSLQESIAAIASSSTPQIINLPNSQVIFTYTPVKEEGEIRKDDKEAKSHLEEYKSIVSPPDSRLPAIKTTENYDADISAGASSDDQEVVQIEVSGTYVIRPKKARQESSSAPIGEIAYTCAKCNITFESASNFIAHNMMHSIFWCLKCERKFRLKSAFLEHLQEHTGRKPFACFRCWRSYATNNEFRIHLNNCPPGKKRESEREDRNRGS